MFGGRSSKRSPDRAKRNQRDPRCIGRLRAAAFHFATCGRHRSLAICLKAVQRANPSLRGLRGEAVAVTTAIHRPQSEDRVDCFAALAMTKGAKLPSPQKAISYPGRGAASVSPDGAKRNPDFARVPAAPPGISLRSMRATAIIIRCSRRVAHQTTIRPRHHRPPNRTAKLRRHERKRGTRNRPSPRPAKRARA